MFLHTEDFPETSIEFYFIFFFINSIGWLSAMRHAQKLNKVAKIGLSTWVICEILGCNSSGIITIHTISAIVCFTYYAQHTHATDIRPTSWFSLAVHSVRVLIGTPIVARLICGYIIQMHMHVSCLFLSLSGRCKLYTHSRTPLNADVVLGVRVCVCVRYPLHKVILGRTQRHFTKNRW